MLFERFSTFLHVLFICATSRFKIVIIVSRPSEKGYAYAYAYEPGLHPHRYALLITLDATVCADTYVVPRRIVPQPAQRLRIP